MIKKWLTAFCIIGAICAVAFFSSYSQKNSCPRQIFSESALLLIFAAYFSNFSTSGLFILAALI